MDNVYFAPPQKITVGDIIHLEEGSYQIFIRTSRPSAVGRNMESGEFQVFTMENSPIFIEDKVIPLWNREYILIEEMPVP